MLVRGFPFSVVYRASDDEILVVAIPRIASDLLLADTRSVMANRSCRTLAAATQNGTDRVGSIIERLRYTARFDDPNLPGVMQTTVSLREVACGAE